MKRLAYVVAVASVVSATWMSGVAVETAYVRIYEEVNRVLAPPVVDAPPAAAAPAQKLRKKKRSRKNEVQRHDPLE